MDRRSVLSGALSSAAALLILPTPGFAAKKTKAAAKPVLKAVGPVTWQKLTTEAYPGKQDDIHFVDPLHGWYGNGAGRLFRTADGGETWELAWDRPGTFIRALGFADTQNGWLGNVGVDYYPGVTDSHPLYRTRDGGKSWDKVMAPGIEKISGICGIDVLNTQAIFQGELRTRTIIHAAGRVGGSAWLMRSVDGGETFSVIDMNPHCGMILDVKFLTATTGFVCAASSGDTAEANAMILRTMDGGKSWSTVYRGTRAFENCWKMSWPKSDAKYGKTAYATVQNYDPAGTKRIFIKTVDGGKSWAEMALVDDAKVREFGIGFVSADHGWIGTTKGGYETRDGGTTWQPIEFGKAVNKIRVVPADPKSGAKGGHSLFAIGVDVFRARMLP
jgi:photosystem II stability/assembly factor-like uncharacterized protein